MNESVNTSINHSLSQSVSQLINHQSFTPGSVGFKMIFLTLEEIIKSDVQTMLRIKQLITKERLPGNTTKYS